MSTQPSRKRKTHRRTFGAVRKLPSGRWQARYRGPDGIERTAPSTFATKSDADNWLATRQADIVRDTWRAPERGDQPLSDYASAWLATRVDLAPRTVALYQRLIDKCLLPRVASSELGRLPLRSITPAVVRQWHADLTRDAASRAHGRAPRLTDTQAARAWALADGQPVATHGRLSPTILESWHAAGSPRPPSHPHPNAGRTLAAQAYTMLRTIMGTAVREGLIDANPCTIAGATVVRRPERIPATPDEVVMLAAAMPDRYAAAVFVAAWSGLRAGELFALRRRDVNLTAGTLRVDRALLEMPGPVQYGPPKSDAGRRTVHLPASVLETLAEHMRHHTDPGRDALVFSTASGQPLRAGQRTAMFRRARATIGRDDLRWHDLRHTGAVLAATAGASLAELQRRIGHSTVRAAMLYQHASDQRDRAIADSMDELARPSGTVTPLHRKSSS